jgi:hypothetical protein
MRCPELRGLGGMQRRQRLDRGIAHDLDGKQQR